MEWKRYDHIFDSVKAKTQPVTLEWQQYGGQRYGGIVNGCNECTATNLTND